MIHTLPETNIAPEYGWLEDEISFWGGLFSGAPPLNNPTACVGDIPKLEVMDAANVPSVGRCERAACWLVCNSKGQFTMNEDVPSLKLT